MVQIVDLIDEVILNYENEEALKAVGDKVNEMMGAFPIFAS
jgi:glycine/serine hydroxymethyltransferase